MIIYSTNILSVGLSVRLQNAKELRYLWMLSSLFRPNPLFYFRKEGVAGLYKGMTPYLVHVMPNICLVFLIYEKIANG